MRVAFVVGVILVAVTLLSTVLGVYERSLLNTFYPYSSSFAFLRSLFPSPWATDLIDWQDIVLLQAVPFLLFFHFAVRERIDPLGRIVPTVAAIVAVGAGLSILNVVLAAYQFNISNLLLNGSLTVPNGFQSESLSGLLISLFTPFPLWSLLRNSLLFAALGVTGMAFGSFSGETPYWILRSWLASRGQPDEDTPVGDVGPADSGVGKIERGNDSPSH